MTSQSAIVPKEASLTKQKGVVIPEYDRALPDDDLHPKAEPHVAD